LVQSLARCRDCGLPSKLAEGLDLSPDGIILLRGARPLRLALLDQDAARRIQTSLEERLTQEACLQVEVEAVRAATSRDLTGLKGRLSRYGALKRRTLEALEDNSLILGLGRIELEKFTPGEGGAMMLRRPFTLGITTAFVTGVLEEMDSCSYGIALEAADGKDFRLVLEAMGPGDGGKQRAVDTGSNKGASTGQGNGDRCRQCGMPSTMAAWRWDELHGSIQAGAGGRRVALLPACILDAFAQLESGGGKTRAGVVEETVYSTTMESLQNGAGDAYEGEELPPAASGAMALCERIRARGWGEVISNRLNGTDWRIDVVNPVDEALIAGWLRAIYTVAMGREPRVEVGGEPLSRHFELA
jgi:hypothetical protein